MMVQPARPLSKGIIVGLDASRNRSGGAIAHINGLLGGADPRAHGIKQVHLFGHDTLIQRVDDFPWLTKHCVSATKHSVLLQVLWQRFWLPILARKLDIQVMFNTDAGSVYPIQPSITLSQDMLSYEPGEMQRYRWLSWARLRLEILKIVQLARLKNSTVAVFLTRHAYSVIGSQTTLRKVEIIPHGIDARFLEAGQQRPSRELTNPIRILYVSNTAPYKHQWHVVEAVSIARGWTGRDLKLRLVGGGSGDAQQRLLQAMATYNVKDNFVEQIPFVPHEQIIAELHAADLFVFASSCENLPITLLEAMAAGVPIACSNRGPMPEILGSVNPYFDPEVPETIAHAIVQLINDPALRDASVKSAMNLSRHFNWKQCADASWKLLASVVDNQRCESTVVSNSTNQENGSHRCWGNIQM